MQHSFKALPVAYARSHLSSINKQTAPTVQHTTAAPARIAQGRTWFSAGRKQCAKCQTLKQGHHSHSSEEQHGGIPWRSGASSPASETDNCLDLPPTNDSTSEPAHYSGATDNHLSDLHDDEQQHHPGSEHASTSMHTAHQHAAVSHEDAAHAHTTTHSHGGAAGAQHQLQHRAAEKLSFKLMEKVSRVRLHQFA